MVTCSKCTVVGNFSIFLEVTSNMNIMYVYCYLRYEHLAFYPSLLFLHAPIIVAEQLIHGRQTLFMFFVLPLSNCSGDTMASTKNSENREGFKSTTLTYIDIILNLTLTLSPSAHPKWTLFGYTWPLALGSLEPCRFQPWWQTWPICAQAKCCQWHSPYLCAGKVIIHVSAQ